jgi:hypothetical protein
VWLWKFEKDCLCCAQRTHIWVLSDIPRVVHNIKVNPFVIPFFFFFEGNIVHNITYLYMRQWTSNEIHNSYACMKWSAPSIFDWLLNLYQFCKFTDNRNRTIQALNYYLKDGFKFSRYFSLFKKIKSEYLSTYLKKRRKRNRLFGLHKWEQMDEFFLFFCGE